MTSHSDPVLFVHDPEKILKFSYGANWDYSIYSLFFQAASDIKERFSDAKVHFNIDDRDHRIAILTIRRPSYHDAFIDEIDRLIEDSNALDALEREGVLITTDFVEE